MRIHGIFKSEVDIRTVPAAHKVFASLRHCGHMWWSSAHRCRRFGDLCSAPPRHVCYNKDHVCHVPASLCVLPSRTLASIDILSGRSQRVLTIPISQPPVSGKVRFITFARSRVTTAVPRRDGQDDTCPWLDGKEHRSLQPALYICEPDLRPSHERSDEIEAASSQHCRLNRRQRRLPAGSGRVSSRGCCG